MNYCSNASASESGLASLLPPEIYHSFFDDIEPVELPTSVLSLPLPPSLSVYTPPSSSASAEPSTSQAGALLDDSELQEFVEQQKNVNTKRKTQSDLRRWYSWCKSVGETRDIGDIPPEQLDRLLGHFYVKVRKSNGEKYEPDSLTAIQRSLDRHLTQDLHRPYSIIRDRLFQSSREKLKAARKSLKKVASHMPLKH